MYVLMLFSLTSCWSARCPRVTCRVRVEHRHGERYFRPREALSWMWTPRYKHVRTPELGKNAGPPKKFLNLLILPSKKVSAKKPR